MQTTGSQGSPQRQRLSLPTSPEQPTQHRPAQEFPTPKPDSIVYLIQEPTVPKHSGRPIDTSPLLWWGKVRVLLERNQTASFRPAHAYAQVRERLKTFDPAKDFIAVAGGDNLAVILTGAVLAQMGHDHFYYLRFERTRLPDGTRDPASGSYHPLRVPLTPDSAQAAISL